MSINLPKLFILFSSIITLNQVKADDMPKGGNVQSGKATISGYNTNHLTIDQKSQKSIIILREMEDQTVSSTEEKY